MKKLFSNITSYIVPLVIMVASFIFRAYYVSIISVYRNQHDGGIPFEAGNLGYIAYFLEHNSFPDFNVSKVDQFWHPPLHYFISAKFLQVVWALFPSQAGNFEIAQQLPLFYVTLSIFFIWKILCLLFSDTHARNMGLFMAAFHPSFLFRSATINNDALITMLVISAVYVILRYIESTGSLTDDFLFPSGRKLLVDHKGTIYILLLLVIFILAMWTKKSAALLAIPIAAVIILEFLLGRISNAVSIASLFLITGPLSLGWYLWMRIKWDIPFSFNWDISDPSLVSGYIGEKTIIQRLMDFSPAHFKYLYTFAGTNTDAIDINPLTLLIKTSANDLWVWSYVDDEVRKLSYIILLLRIIITIILSVSFILLLVNWRESEKSVPPKNMVMSDALNDYVFTISAKLVFGTFTLVTLISYYIFSFKNPYVCSMNYRYIEHIVMSEAVLMGYAVRKNIWAKWLCLGVTLLLAAANILKILYFQP